MFKRQVEATLKSVNLDSDGEWRIAHCLFYVTLDYELAKEVSPKVADSLFRLHTRSDWKRGMPDFEPRLELHHVSFDGFEFAPQRMEFRALPSVPNAGAVVPGVEIRKLEALKLKGSEDLTLAIVVKLRFTLQQRAVISTFLIDHLKQSVWLTFQEQQKGLPLEKHQEEGAFMNKRASEARQGSRVSN